MHVWMKHSCSHFAKTPRKAQKHLFLLPRSVFVRISTCDQKLLSCFLYFPWIFKLIIKVSILFLKLTVIFLSGICLQCLLRLSIFYLLRDMFHLTLKCSANPTIFQESRDWFPYQSYISYAMGSKQLWRRNMSCSSFFGGFQERGASFDPYVKLKWIPVGRFSMLVWKSVLKDWKLIYHTTATFCFSFTLTPASLI